MKELTKARAMHSDFCDFLCLFVAIHPRRHVVGAMGFPLLVPASRRARQTSGNFAMIAACPP
jgi:hypothetical protein